MVRLYFHPPEILSLIVLSEQFGFELWCVILIHTDSYCSFSGRK